MGSPRWFGSLDSSSLRSCPQAAANELSPTRRNHKPECVTIERAKETTAWAVGRCDALGTLTLCVGTHHSQLGSNGASCSVGRLSVRTRLGRHLYAALSLDSCFDAEDIRDVDFAISPHLEHTNGFQRPEDCLFMVRR